MKLTLKTFILLLLVTFLFLPSCSSLMDGLSASLYQQKDIQLVKEGAPAFLLLVEGLIHSNPKNRGMLALGIQLFSAYSSAFVTEPERSKIFLDKSKEWALMLLRTYPKFKKYENAEFDEYQTWVKSLKKHDVPNVFWAANAWIFWIIANVDSMEAVMDLPKARVIIDKIYELDDSFYYGAPHLFYGIYYSMLPENAGGDLKKAKEEFDKALEYSKKGFLMTKISYAQFYCKATYNREEYKKVLEEVINTDLDKFPELRLLNSFALKQARDLLDGINEYFYEDDF